MQPSSQGRGQGPCKGRGKGKGGFRWAPGPTDMMDVSAPGYSDLVCDSAEVYREKKRLKASQGPGMPLSAAGLGGACGAAIGVRKVGGHYHVNSSDQDLIEIASITEAGTGGGTGVGMASPSRSGSAEKFSERVSLMKRLLFHIDCHAIGQLLRAVSRMDLMVALHGQRKDLSNGHFSPVFGAILLKVQCFSLEDPSPL